MKILFTSLIFAAALGGCATQYTYEGQKYSSKEAFLQAVEDRIANTISSITPLKAPLSNKKLIMAIPSFEVLHSMGVANFVKINNREPNSLQAELGRNLNRSNYLNVKVFLDAVHKKNIYRETQFIEMQSGSDTLAPSTSADVLYLAAMDVSSTQWYFGSEKNGREIFAYDRSSTNMTGKVQAFLEAVQTRAIRE
jgi:hypothetical protein